MTERAFSPRSRPRRPSRRFRAVRHLARSERGTALIEFALVLPILAAILFGGIDFGFVFKDFISARQGVSDAIRQAAVGQFGPSCGSGTPTAKIMCNVHSQMGLDNNVARVTIDVGDSTHQSSGGYVKGQPITICVQYKLNSVTGILGPIMNQRVATSTATDMIEQVNASGPPSGTATEAVFKPWPANSPCTKGAQPS